MACLLGNHRPRLKAALSLFHTCYNIYAQHFTSYQTMRLDQIHKSHNAPVPYLKTNHSEPKCTHCYFEWCIIGYGTGASWDLSIWSNMSKWRYRILRIRSAWNQDRTVAALKRKCPVTLFGDILVIGCMESTHFDNFRPMTKITSNDNISASMCFSGASLWELWENVILTYEVLPLCMVLLKERIWDPSGHTTQ